MWLILEGSNRVPRTRVTWRPSHRRLSNSFIWRIALLEWNALGILIWKIDLRGTWRNLRINWKHNVIEAVSPFCMCVFIWCFSLSLILPPYSWQRSWLAQLVPSGQSLVGQAFPHPVIIEINPTIHGIICLFISGHLSQRGYSEKRWVHKAALGLQGESVGKPISLWMGEWTEHPPWLTCPDQALGLPQLLCGKRIRLQSRRHRRRRFIP